MKKALILLLVAALLLTSAAQASNYFEDCDYYRQHGVHNFKDLYWATHPSCTEVGVMWVECKTCGYTAIAPRDTAPHNYGPWTEIKAATDNSKGMRSHKCKDCGASATEEFYPSGTVYPGRNKEAIIELQEMLAELGLLARVTGEYDKATEDALRTVQKEANFPITGIGWPQTLAYLQQKLGGNTTAPVAEPTAAPQQESVVPAAAAPDEHQFTQQPFCSKMDISTGVVATVYCAAHQELIESCEAMLSLAQTDALRLQALTMYRMMLESDLQLRYAQWHEAAADETKQLVLSHQAMSTNYLAMQEMTWKLQYGETDVRVLENVVNALKQQCSEVCMMSAQDVTQGY